MVKYYYAGGQRIAMRVGAGGASSTLTYLLGDHFGSTSLTYKGDTGVTTTQRYTPWGSLRPTGNNALLTDYTYTGQYSHTADFGLMYYVARWDDPVLGRFAQADSIVPGAGKPMAWDRYAYGNNSPLNFNDPSGHIACSPHRPCEPTTPYIPPPTPTPTPTATATPTPTLTATSTPTPTFTPMPNVPATAESAMATNVAGNCPGANFSLCPTPTSTLWSPPPTPALPSNWEIARAAAEPFTIGLDAFTGTSVGYNVVVEQAAIEISGITGNPQIAALAPLIPVVATGYAVAYDNITNSGDYNVEVGPVTPTQIGITILTIMIVIPILPPFP